MPLHLPPLRRHAPVSTLAAPSVPAMRRVDCCLVSPAVIPCQLSERANCCSHSRFSPHLLCSPPSRCSHFHPRSHACFPQTAPHPCGCASGHRVLPCPSECFPPVVSALLLTTPRLHLRIGFNSSTLPYFNPCVPFDPLS
jgi:hypothetical protein